MNFIDLHKQYAALKDEIDSNMQNVLNRTSFIFGKEVEDLERELSEYVGRKHCVSCGNGTDALSLVLSSWGIGKNDAVFVPDFTFFASAEVVSNAGAQPIFVDIDKDTFNICVESLEDKIKMVLHDGRFAPKAIIAVDLFGLPANFSKIQELAQKYNLKILEDGAQGFGGNIGNRRACSFGDASTTSFFPAKPLGCYGDGGAIFTDDDAIAGLLRSLRFHGKGEDKYDNVRIGCNSRLDNLQAAILLPKLKAFKDFELDARHRIALKYDSFLSGFVKTPKIPEGFGSSYAQYTILLSDNKKRDALKQFLADNKVPSMIYYPRCMHELKAYADYPFVGTLPVAELCSKCVLSLPMYPYLQDEEIEFVSSKVIEGISKL